MKRTSRKKIICILLTVMIAVCAYAASVYGRKENETVKADTENEKAERNDDKADNSSVSTVSIPDTKEDESEKQDSKDESKEENKPAANNNPGTSSSDSQSSDNPASSSIEHKGHWETRYETIPAYDEQVLVKEGYYENVLVKDAWDEEDTYCYAWGQDQIEVEVCNTCGAQFQGGINQHLSETGHSGWHNDYILSGDPYCQEYKTDYIHHDAVYDRIWHEPEYKTVHHPEETRSYQVWVEG